ncbi:MAG: hypothetical protein QXJ25_03755 [Candidatus Aenigmatarchaeota archaeon]
MDNKIYIMVTHWRDHWDSVEKTYYTRKVIKLRIEEIEEDVSTIFVKRNEANGEIEHIFIGRISEIKKESNRVYFKVNKEKKISLYELEEEFPGLTIPKESGWYIHMSIETQLCPLFLKPLKK